MFETGTYKSLPKHMAIYEALEASMERENRDELLTEMNKSCKRKHADQDPSPPPLDSDHSKRRRHDTDASVYHSLKLLSHQHGRSLTHEMLLQAPLSNNLQRPKWLKPIPDDERPVTPEPTWVIPSTHTPDDVNNWANALATMYQAPAKNSLLKKNKIDWANPEGDQVRNDIIKAFPLSGPPGHVTI
nr:hypothetical protein [Tanacetum cinerariifolium]